MTIIRTLFSGISRRAIDLQRRDAETVVGWLEDDYHHLGITLVHDGHTIRDFRTYFQRYPWSTCPQAQDPLSGLIGKPLVSRASDIGKLTNMRLQCTHLFDLAGLLAAHALEGRDHRIFKVTVTAPNAHAGDDYRLRGILEDDGKQVLSWDVEGSVIVEPAAIAGQSTERGFREWTETMALVDAERALVLRRALFIAANRRFNRRGVMEADSIDFGAVCYTFQPETRKAAVRACENFHPFDDIPEQMLSLRDTKP